VVVDVVLKLVVDVAVAVRDEVVEVTTVTVDVALQLVVVGVEVTEDVVIVAVDVEVAVEVVLGIKGGIANTFTALTPVDVPTQKSFKPSGSPLTELSTATGPA